MALLSKVGCQAVIGWRALCGALDEAVKVEGVGRVELIRRAVVDWLTAKGFLQGSA